MRLRMCVNGFVSIGLFLLLRSTADTLLAWWGERSGCVEVHVCTQIMLSDHASKDQTGFVKKGNSVREG